jgi:heme-degrading monooxygenase HmoA
MFVRTTTVIGDPTGIDRATALLRDEAMPMLARLDGFVGLSSLVDRHTGRCITASAWQSAQAMRDSEAPTGAFRGRYVAALGGEETALEEWEVALMHRAHHATEGSAARVTWLEGDVYTIDDSIDVYRSSMATLEGLPGFASASLLIDRRTAQAASTVCYDTRAALERNRTRANEVRARIAEQSGVEVIEVAEFEVALAHLAVPELV